MTRQETFEPWTAAVPTQWTGRAEIDLVNGRGWLVGTVLIAIDTDALTLHHGPRRLAVFDRDQFREWLTEPVGTLTTEHVSWTRDNGLTSISIDGRSSLAVPGECLQHLLAVV